MSFVPTPPPSPFLSVLRTLGMTLFGFVSVTWHSFWRLSGKIRTVVAVLTLGLCFLGWRTCREKPAVPSQLDSLVAASTTQVVTGDILDFVRYEGNVVIENATVRKVEGHHILISPAGSQEEPFWINLENALSFRKATVKPETKKESPAVSPADEEEANLRAVASFDDIVRILAETDVDTPRSQPVPDLGILELSDWERSLNRKMPDFIMPGQLIVTDVRDSYATGVAGTYEGLPSEPAEGRVTIRRIPGEALVRMRAEHGRFSRESMTNGPLKNLPKFRQLRKGDKVNIIYQLRPSIDVSRETGKTEITVSVFETLFASTQP